MNEQLIKYYGEQDDRHPGQLIWPGYMHIPVLAPMNTSVHKIPEDLYPVGFFHCHRFLLSDEQEQDYYTWVMDRIVNGWFTQLHISRYDDGVYLEWCQRYWRVKNVPH